VALASASIGFGTGCTSERPLIAVANDWLNEDAVLATISREMNSYGTGSARAEHALEMRKLQMSADVLLEISNGTQVTVLRSPAGLAAMRVTLTTLKDWLRPMLRHKTIKLVVIEVSDTVELDTLRSVDSILRAAGAKRRVYQHYGPTDYYQLDSATVTKTGGSHTAGATILIGFRFIPCSQQLQRLLRNPGIRPSKTGETGRIFRPAALMRFGTRTLYVVSVVEVVILYITGMPPKPPASHINAPLVFSGGDTNGPPVASAVLSNACDITLLYPNEPILEVASLCKGEWYIPL
jgi:hypothetical protein